MTKMKICFNYSGFSLFFFSLIYFYNLI